MTNFLFTSESVTEGHPDKVSDRISDSVLDAILTQDNTARVAFETLLTTGMAIIAGDITPDEDGELLAIVAECLDDPATFEPFVDSFIAGAAEGGTELTRDEARCAIRALEEDGDDAAILACLSDETVDAIEDPTIDLLSAQCRRGNNQACDELFRGGNHRPTAYHRLRFAQAPR